MARKSKKLETIINMIDIEEKIEEEELEKLDFDKEFILTLQSNANLLSDKRDSCYSYHSIESVLLLVIFGIMANCNTFVRIYLFMLKHQEWLQKHIMFDFGLPSLSTIKRVIGMINTKELETIFNESLSTFIDIEKPYYKDNDIEIKDLKSMDGKTANSSDRKASKNGEISKTNAMSLYSVKNDRTEATEFIEDKTNEIPTGIDLLKRVNIDGSIVVFDAMSTQTKTIDYIASHGAYYVAPVKGNQSNLEEDIKQYFDDKELYRAAKEKSYYETIEKSHGGETRKYIFTDDINWLYKKEEWKDIKSIGLAERTYVNKNGEIVTDTRYYISNINYKKIELLSKAIRGEWTIENGLHLYLDMVFLEDENKCFLDNSQKNLNIIRKFCLALLKRYKIKTKLSMDSVRFNISMDFENEIEKVITDVLF